MQAGTRPDQSVGVFPYFPLLHFLADRRGPHRAGYIVWPFPEIPARDRAIVDAMEAQQTPLVIYHFTQFLTLPRMEEYAPELYAYLVERFDSFRNFHADRFGYKLAALRREPPPSGRPLLTQLSDAALAIESGGVRREVAPGARDAFARIETWPFRPALALRPTAGGRSVLSLPLRPEPGSHLRTAVGAHPDQWFGFPPSAVDFRIDVVSGEARETLYARRLDPQRRLEDRGWFEVDLPLDAYAGREVVLELSTGAEGPSGETLRSAGFALPRLEPEGLRATTR